MTATATVGDLVTQTRRLITGTARGALNQLNADINSSVTTLNCTYDLGANVVKSAYLTIDDEILYVWSVDSSTKTVTVARAQLGTTAASHTASTIIEVGARFPKPLIRDALYDEINSWPKQVYATAATNLDVGTNSYGVDLGTIPSTFYDVLQVLKKPIVNVSNRYDTLATLWKNVGYRVERHLDTAEFASGAALFLNDAWSGGYRLRVVYSRPFDLSGFSTDATSLTAAVGTGLGMEPSMTDIAPYGAAWRLVSGREVLRTATEAAGEARAAGDVAQGSIIRAASALEQFRDKRLAEEANILLARHSWRRTA